MGRTLDVLRGIDLNIYAGEILGIVGPSGAGKSTLLHCIGTLDLPTSGRIRLDGEELTTLGGARLAAIRNRTIGFVFQFHHLLPEFNALENVMMPGLIHGKSKRGAAKRARALLDEVGLAAPRDAPPRRALRRRAAARRARARARRSIRSSCSPTSRPATSTPRRATPMHDLFFEINREHGTTIVVVTHNPAFAERMPRVVHMRDGKVERDERVARGARAREVATPYVVIPSVADR